MLQFLRPLLFRRFAHARESSGPGCGSMPSWIKTSCGSRGSLVRCARFFLALSMAAAARHMSAIAVVSLWSLGITESMASSIQLRFFCDSFFFCDGPSPSGSGDFLEAESPPPPLQMSLSVFSWRSLATSACRSRMVACSDSIKAVCVVSMAMGAASLSPFCAWSEPEG